ncbi:unnamed protein product [Didymodactylos carnosus]|uniref:VWFA domain-containing protein n=1 Tax=Didymodactylos carnosus TaxID=1234261 RepID=A0A815AL59_9BILA|nr:unnamed protein product [Didymodactylos carnosus]CAF1475336.1 unnamed protein product [Didymodactylos carnosus]CAF4038718.1 unnamed protein product [Didymodactylos carnosus]CAF4266668.1 unnamed protein product [Didymodactylos carnosus]
MKDIDTKDIIWTDSATAFGPAFQLVIDVIKINSTAAVESGIVSEAGQKDKNLQYIIVLMSDGEAEYPETELNSLSTRNLQIKEFWTVALGLGQMSILEQINAKMDGTYKQLKDSCELFRVYAEIAQS